MRVLMELSNVAYFVTTTVFLSTTFFFISCRQEANRGTSRGAKFWVFAGSAVILCFMIALCVLIASIRDATQRLSLLDSIAECDSAQSTLTLNGTMIDSATPFLTEFLLAEAPLSRKSHAAVRVDVVVTCNKQNVEFVLGQDSEFPDEFWLFRNGPSIPKRHAQIGTVTSPALRKWLNQSSSTDEEPPLVDDPIKPIHWWVINTLVWFLLLPFLFWLVGHFARYLIALIPKPKDDDVHE